MNKQATNKRHKCKVLSNFVDNIFTIEAIEIVLLIVIHFGLDCDNFSDLHRLRDPFNGRRFYKVTTSLNRFKCFDNCRNRLERQHDDKLATFREVGKY